MCVCVVDVTGTNLSCASQRRQFFNLGNTVKNIMVWAEDCSEDLHPVYQFSAIYIDTPRDAAAAEIYGDMKYGCVHSEKKPNAAL